jgi:pyrroloquinoline quinone biosynthesis protein E
MAEYAKSKNIYVIFYDNFYFLDEKNANAIIDMGLDEIYASIDGATKETYEKIRVGSDFEKVTGNIKRLFRLKRTKGKNYPLINFHYTINEYNLDEIVQFIEMVGEMSGGEKTIVQLKKLIDGQGENKAPHGTTYIPADLTKKINEIAKKTGVFIKWENIPSNKKSEERCEMWLTPMINTGGLVMPCCFASAQNGYLGNLHDKNFKEIWCGEDYKKFRNMIKSGKIPSICKDCGRYYLKKIF